jgi:formylglycine-generating enzyme required for sulfatase activity
MPTNDTKTYIVNDQVTEIDALDFTPYVDTLADIIQTGNTPLTIGVFGTWGSGKTSLMRMVKNKIPDDFTIAWFDAWKYDKEESLWRAFLLCVLTALKERARQLGKPFEEYEKLQSLLYRDMEIEKVGGVTIDLAKLGGVAAKGLAQISLSFIPGLSTLTKLVEELQSGVAKDVDEATSAIRRERTKIYIEQIQFLEQFQTRFRELVQEHVKPNRFVVFIDDLDRCLPEKAIGVLEAIKLFLDVENCVFVIGLDQEVIARGIEMKYKELGAKHEGDTQPHFTVEGVRYLEKIIQLPFQIPPVEQANMGDFVKGLIAKWPRDECSVVFAKSLEGNPRLVKRTVNTFLLLWNLAERRRLDIAPICLAKVVAIQAIAPRLYELIKNNHTLLRDIESNFRAEVLAEKVTYSYTSSSKNLKKGQASSSQLPQDLLNLINKTPSVIEVFKLFINLDDANFTSNTYDELKAYFTLTRRTEIIHPPVSQKPAQSNRVSQPLAQQPVFEPQMVKIPSGKSFIGSTPEQINQFLKDGADESVILSEYPQHTLDLPDYYIGKYLITNAQYKVFVQSAGYKAPDDWEGSQFSQGKDAHPVINVTWNDAVAYCEWLKQKTGKIYRLPSEVEWEKAARGEDGRIWPWAGGFNRDATNTREIQIGTTTPVGQFSPLGDSIYGCVDMIGNVWEWTLSLWGENWEKPNFGYPYILNDERENIDAKQAIARVIRGGSFNDSHVYARCAARGGGFPNTSIGCYGFRVALTLDKANS